MAASTRLTPEQRSLRARLAIQTRWSTQDPGPTMAKARAGLRAKFLCEVDPDGVLPDDERVRRAESAFQAHMTRLAYLSSKARADRAAGKAARKAAKKPQRQARGAEQDLAVPESGVPEAGEGR